MNQPIVPEFSRRFPRIAEELGPENLARLLGACTLVDLRPGRRLFRLNMPVESIYMVLEGELVASLESGGQRIELGIAREGDWLGEIAVLSGDRVATATITSCTPCRLLKMHFRDFESLVLHDPEISHVLLGQLISLLSTRLRQTLASGQQLARA